MRRFVQTFFLHRSIEPLNVRIVIGLTNSAMTMTDPHPPTSVREPCGKFRAMV